MQKKLGLLFFYLIMLVLTGCSYDDGTSTSTSTSTTIQEVNTTTSNGNTTTGTSTTAAVLIAKSLTVDIISEEDDAEEFSDFSVSTSSADIDFGDSVVNAFRFQQLTIPQGSQITSAYIQFTADKTNTRDTNVTIHGEKSPNATVFLNKFRNISLRNNTVVSVEWHISGWTGGDRTFIQKTDDIKSIVQEVVDQEGWISGNSIAFIIEGVGKRASVSYKAGTEDNSAQLVVEYNLKDIDTDGDGQRNSVDTDDDNDGVIDTLDKFTLDSSETLDADGDGIGNNADTDDDNDGVSDVQEALDGTNPFNANDFIDARKGTIEPVIPVAKFHRVVWNSDASSSAIVSFNPNGTEDSFYIKYGQTTNEIEWGTKDVRDIKSFDTNLTSFFSRLTGLKADSPVYYRICDGTNCGDRYWFKTAPSDINTSFIFVAGGDTKGDRAKRTSGNKLIAKIRPLFVMHGGDFTNANNTEEMGQFLTDWVSTFSNDTIDGVGYKRVYPLVPTHGTSEDTDFLTMCSVFGLDSNEDGDCSLHDSYSAFNVSKLLRIYTLNTQLAVNNLEAEVMNGWLSGDMRDEGSQVTWRIAQYHKAMITHTSARDNNQTIFNWWAQLFADNGMNVVIESDSNVAKSTKIVQPSSSSFDFVESIFGGTLYVGEGSWGSVNNDADVTHSWTQDSKSVNQFKVIVVKPTALEISTVEIDPATDNTLALTYMERENNATVLPRDITLWDVQGIGETTILKLNSKQQSISGN